jgi:hypothetical protein
LSHTFSNLTPRTDLSFDVCNPTDCDYYYGTSIQNNPARRAIVDATATVWNREHRAVERGAILAELGLDSETLKLDSYAIGNAYSQIMLDMERKGQGIVRAKGSGKKHRMWLPAWSSLNPASSSAPASTVPVVPEPSPQGEQTPLRALVSQPPVSDDDEDTAIKLCEEQIAIYQEQIALRQELKNRRSERSQIDSRIAELESRVLKF